MKAKRKRRDGILPTVGLVVEGDTEFAAFPLLHTKRLIPHCPPLRAINLGGVGSDLTPEAIARMIKPKVIQHRAAGRKRVVICIDREQRAETAVALGTQVLQALQALLLKDGHAATDITVTVADRVFEAWILADARGLHARGMFKKAPSFHSFEGAMGKQQRKGLVELADLLGRPYSKTKDGPQLFAKLDFVTARKHAPGDYGSRSLHAFLACL